ncbi:MAG: hypothetical protein WAR23_07150, partial [Dethiobacteria bacterium]
PYNLKRNTIIGCAGRREARQLRSERLEIRYEMYSPDSEMQDRRRCGYIVRVGVEARPYGFHHK